MVKVSPFGERKYRPWSFEFQGARYWPYGAIEARQDEEREYRRMVDSAPVPLSLEPRAVVSQERYSLSSPVRFVALPSRSPWRPHTIPGVPGYEPSYSMNNHDNQFQKRISDADNYFVGSLDPRSNASRYQDTSLNVHYNQNSSRHASPYSRHYLDPDNRLYGGKFPMILPAREPSKYMNFVHSQWIR